MLRCGDLRHKEVINVSDGRRIGFVGDIEIDFESGRIDAIVIPAGGRMFGFIGRESEIVIPWEKITRIGEDIVLVNLDDRFLRKYFDL